MAKTRAYFAYGSNINLDQMARRCPNAKVVGPVKLEGYELTFRGRMDGSGVANIEPKEGSVVHGLLWRITPSCEAALDLYEGAPRLYAQQNVAVRDSKGRKRNVMAYVMTEQFREPAMPSRYYFDGILDGFRQNGMDEAPLLEALDKCRDEVYSALKLRQPYKKQQKKGRQNER